LPYNKSFLNSKNKNKSCLQGKSIVGKEFATYTGFNQLGDLNNIIIVYPQVRSRTINPTNPSGCWDWWGYTNSLYGKK
jgi:poly(3-hydroxybutyrate) depolymerase